MPIEKIGDHVSGWDGFFCKSREHNPPQGLYLAPGIYKWICPDCGKYQMLYVR